MNQYGQLIGELTLRNDRRVYESGNAYWVVQVDRHGTEHAQEITSNVIEYVGRRLAGQEVAVEDAVEVLSEAVTRLRLPFSYGHKLRFYVQDVLIVLVALDRADLRRVGPRFFYDIH